MRRSVVSIFVIGVGLLLGPASVVGHHSIAAEFDVNSPIEFTGVVKVVDWLNPHIYTHVEVREADGNLIVYKVEGGAPNALFRNGWRKESLKIGETVTVRGVRAKNPNSMNVGQATIITSDGTRYFAGPAAAQQ